MKTEPNWWTAVLSAGIAAGYATTVVQLSPGPGYVFSVARKWLTDSAASVADDRELPPRVRQLGMSVEELAYCGWCLSPWAALPAWTVAARMNGVRFGVRWLLGWAIAAAIAAFLRNTAEREVV